MASTARVGGVVVTPTITPEVSIIIPALNAENWMSHQLEALASQRCSCSWEVIVADNGSTDHTREVASRWADRIDLRVVDAGDQRGVGHARNVGAAAAMGRYLCFCDADDVVSSSWIKAMRCALEDHDAVAGALDITALNDHDSQSRRGSIHLERGLKRVHGFLPFASTANLGVRREVFWELDGFKEEYRYGAPDKEFSWRLQLAGYKLGFSPEAVVHYRNRQSIWSTLIQRYRFGRADPRLYRDFRASGMPPSGFQDGLRAWFKLLRRGPGAVRSQRARYRLMREVAMRLGRLVGSIRFRVLYL